MKNYVCDLCEKEFFPEEGISADPNQSKIISERREAGQQDILICIRSYHHDLCWECVYKILSRKP